LEGINASIPEKQRPKGWPKSPRGLSNFLRRLGPALSTMGVSVEWPKERGARGIRRILIRRALEENPETVGDVVRRSGGIKGLC